MLSEPAPGSESSQSLRGGTLILEPSTTWGKVLWKSPDFQPKKPDLSILANPLTPPGLLYTEWADSFPSILRPDHSNGSFWGRGFALKVRFLEHHLEKEVVLCFLLGMLTVCPAPCVCWRGQDLGLQNLSSDSGLHTGSWGGRACWGH